MRLGGLQVTTGMPQLLDGLARRLAFGRSLLAISAVQILLLAAAASRWRRACSLAIARRRTRC